ncbi:hypothetical protein JHU04_002912 [Brenneria sp. 4F2]|nr:hypothetical protein [Brenneria bubanii]
MPLGELGLIKPPAAGTEYGKTMSIAYVTTLLPAMDKVSVTHCRLYPECHLPQRIRLSAADRVHHIGKNAFFSMHW